MFDRNPAAIIPLHETKREYFLAIEALYNSSFALSPWKEGAFERFKNDIRRAPIGFIAMDGDTIIGLVLGKKPAVDSQTYILSSLLVHPNYRGLGVADILLGKFLLTAKRVSGVKKIVLHFRASNNLASFYSRAGFKLVKTNEHYSNGEGKLLMEMPI